MRLVALHGPLTSPAADRCIGFALTVLAHQLGERL
jgi:hypothetical protein